MVRLWLFSRRMTGVETREDVVTDGEGEEAAAAEEEDGGTWEGQPGSRPERRRNDDEIDEVVDDGRALRNGEKQGCRYGGGGGGGGGVGAEATDAIYTSIDASIISSLLSASGRDKEGEEEEEEEEDDDDEETPSLRQERVVWQNVSAETAKLAAEVLRINLYPLP
jgi:hypothetical protein